MVDYSDARIAQERMGAACLWKHNNFTRVGKARLVVAMFSDRKKKLLAKYTTKGVSVAQGQNDARQNPEYEKELEGPDGIVAQAEAAFITLEEADDNESRFEAARSMNSYNRERLRQLPED